MAQLRFGDLVKKSGSPHAVTLWTDPKQDPAFTKAMRENRVLTVKQEPGQTDYGMVGFHQDPRAQYLLFPKPLTAKAPARVIGIKYDLITQPDVRDPVASKDLKPAPPKKAPVANSFEVHVRRTAVTMTTITVEAADKTEAKKKALESAKTEAFDLNKAAITDAIESID